MNQVNIPCLVQENTILNFSSMPTANKLNCQWLHSFFSNKMLRDTESQGGVR